MEDLKHLEGLLSEINILVNSTISEEVKIDMLYDNFMVKIACKFINVRAGSKMSQRKFAKRLGVKRSTLIYVNWI